MKRDRKILSTAPAPVIAASVGLTGCASQSDTASSGGASSTATPTVDKKMALLCSAVGTNGSGYNQTTINDLNQLRNELGADVKVVGATTDYPDTFETLARTDHELIFSLEYDFTALVEDVGSEEPPAGQFPGITSVVFNANPNLDKDGKVIHKNVISVIFDINETSFLAGVLSMAMNKNALVPFNPSKRPLTTMPDGCRVGFISGTQSTGIEALSCGLTKDVNYEVKKLGNNVVCTIHSTSGISFSNTMKGATTADIYRGEGVDIVYTVAGSTGGGVDAEAKEVKKPSI